MADLRRQRRELVVVEVKRRQGRELANLRWQGGESQSNQIQIVLALDSTRLDPLQGFGIGVS